MEKKKCQNVSVTLLTAYLGVSACMHTHDYQFKNNDFENAIVWDFADI